MSFLTPYCCFASKYLTLIWRKTYAYFTEYNGILPTTEMSHRNNILSFKQQMENNNCKNIVLQFLTFWFSYTHPINCIHMLSTFYCHLKFKINTYNQFVSRIGVQTILYESEISLSLCVFYRTVSICPYQMIAKWGPNYLHTLL